MNPETLDRLENGIVIRHAHFEDVFNKTLRAVQYGRSDEPICVFGPTGMGKTTMERFLVSEFMRRQNNGWRKGHAAPIMIEVPPQNSNTFSWKDFIEDILIKLGDTDVSKKKDLDAYERNKRAGGEFRENTNLRIGALENILRNRINVLKPIAILFDESQNIVEGLPPREKKTNVNRIKNWANTMDTKFLLFGTHEASGLLNINEQLSRRIVPIYFPRYRRSDSEEYKQFSYFFGNLVRELELNLDPSILKSFNFIYNHSLGSPGVLVSWIHECVAFCIDRKLSKITKSNMQKHRMTNDRLRVIEQAIKNFEAYYESTLEEFNPDEVFADDIGQLDLGLGPTQHKSSKKKTDKKSFKRNPKRHKVHSSES